MKSRRSKKRRKTASIPTGDPTRGRLLFKIGIAATLLPMVFHLLFLARTASLSDITLIWVIQSMIWPTILFLVFRSIWRGSQKNLRSFGWMLAVGGFFAAIILVAPKKREIPAPIWPSACGWTVAASLFLLSRDIRAFVYAQSTKQKP
jgi:chromate transport protein ChrA